MFIKSKNFAFLHCTLFVYVICALLEKYSSKYIFMSFEFCLFYILVVGLLGVYALLWQQVLKRIDLNMAFANKSITVIWGIILGFLIFNEQITLTTIFGAFFVLIGIMLVVQE